MSTLKTIKATLASANQAIAELRATDEQLRAAHADAVRERKRLMSAKEPRAQVVANMRALVDDLAMRHRKESGHSHVAAMSGSMTHSVATRDIIVKKPELRNAFAPLSLADLAALMPEVLKANLEAIILSQPESDGLPYEQRPAALTAIDARLREIEDQHTELVNVGTAAGISIKLLPAVVERRKLEALARQHARSDDEETREGGELNIGAHTIN